MKKKDEQMESSKKVFHWRFRQCTEGSSREEINNTVLFRTRILSEEYTSQ